MPPSDFARSICAGLRREMELLDLGCGDGRDSLYFLQHGLRVTGIDASDVAIEKLKSMTADNSMASFICGDFVRCEEIYRHRYDCVYSRFTLHAVDDFQQDELLRNVRNSLRAGGRIFIEARTVHDELFGRGEKVGDNMFIYDGHFRRFIVPEQLLDVMTSLGFKVLSCEENNGFSKCGNSDPMLLRLTAQINGF